MDDSPLDRLPRAYRLGLRLRELGADDYLIAECLDVDPASIGTLIEIGTRKLERVQSEDPSLRDDDNWRGQ